LLLARLHNPKLGLEARKIVTLENWIKVPAKMSTGKTES
jgi:hypothetical protein